MYSSRKIPRLMIVFALAQGSGLGANSAGAATGGLPHSLGSIAANYSAPGKNDAASPPRSRRNEPCPSILAHGGDGHGLADNSAAFDAAVAAGPVERPCVRLPAGVYFFASSPEISLSSRFVTGSAAIIGDGPELTVIKMAAGVSGPSVTLNARFQTLSVRDLTIAASAKELAATGLSLAMGVDLPDGPNPGHNDVENIQIRGFEGSSIGESFATGLNISGLSNVEARNIAIWGGCGPGYCPPETKSIGINVSGTANRIPVSINLSQIDVYGYGYGFFYGSFTQGVAMSQVNFVGNYIGLYEPAGINGNDQLAIMTSHMNSLALDIDLAGSLSGISIVGCNFYIYQNGVAAIRIEGGEAAITGNVITQITEVKNPRPPADGIIIGNTYAFPKVITGNTFRGLGTAVWLQAGSSSTNVQSNSYLANRVDVLSQGTKSNVVGGGSQ